MKICFKYTYLKLVPLKINTLAPNQLILRFLHKPIKTQFLHNGS